MAAERPESRRHGGPLRVVLASIGVGLAWTASHFPADVAQAGIAAWVGLTADALTAILAALSVLKVGAALLGLCVRLVESWVTTSGG